MDSFKSRLRKMRTGRAQASLLENIKVNYYGALTPLIQMSTISTPSPRSLAITPFDMKSLKDIEQALIKANLGMTPQNDGKVIRLTIPELTEERRQDLVKEAKKEAEKCRVDLRNNRRKINDDIKKLAKDKVINEDRHKELQDEIQKITNEFINQIDQVLKSKEKEILES